jgi:hypothetical protein
MTHELGEIEIGVAPIVVAGPLRIVLKQDVLEAPEDRLRRLLQSCSATASASRANSAKAPFRKNLFDLRRAAAIQNLEAVQRLTLAA